MIVNEQELEYLIGERRPR